MNRLLLLLWSYLFPGVDGDEPDGPDTPDTPDLDDEPADTPDDTDTPADDTDDTPPDDEPPAPRESRAQRAIRETRERAQTAEAQLATARAELEVARRPSQPAQPTEEQRLWQQEDEVLRNPETTDWQRYAVNAARTARQSQASSQAALRHAEDLSDRSTFAALASTKPKLYAAYKDRVESKLTELRKEGRNVNREGILKVLIGEDMLAGKLKTADAKPKTQGAAPRTGSPRSDVSASGGARLSDAEKRAKRLENVRI